MNTYIELLQILRPLAGILLPFLTFGWAVGIRTRCREMIWQRLRLLYSKRALKEDQRFPETWFGWLTLRRERRLGQESGTIRRLAALSNVTVSLLIPAELICFLGKRAPLCTWIAFGIMAAEAVVSLVLCVLCVCGIPRQKRQKSPYKKISVPAYVLRYGYLLSGTLFFITGHYLIGGLFALGEAVHTWLARRLHADHFYCMMQNYHHKPMTPHHHTPKFCESADKDANVIIAVSAAVGITAIISVIITEGLQ